MPSPVCITPFLLYVIFTHSNVLSIIFSGKDKRILDSALQKFSFTSLRLIPINTASSNGTDGDGLLSLEGCAAKLEGWVASWMGGWLCWEGWEVKRWEGWVAKLGVMGG